jgi:radical SAM superfamily enzyme YgiQ (UPF0313 family)
MSVKFLFIYPDFLEQTKNVRTLAGNYNEGIASISAMLKSRGHETALYHMTYMPDKAEFERKIREFAPDIIGLTLRTTIVPCATEFLGWLDDSFPDIPVFAGGYHPSLAPEETLAIRGIDAVCIGEGELVVADFIDLFEKSGKFDLAADSFWFNTPEGIVKNPVRQYEYDLDKIPFPDLDLFDYRNLKSNKINTAEVIVSRGCLYACTYCANAELRNNYADKKNYARFRSPENAIEYLERIIERDPDIKYFNFNDAILNMFPEWFYKFADLYKEKIHRKFTCNLRFDHMDERMVQTIAEMGCYLVTIGLENGSEEFRKKYLYRSMENEHIIKVAGWMKQNGIRVVTYNILGLPHETLALSLETIKLNARLKADQEVTSMFFPYPGTRLHEISKEGGFLHPDIKSSDRVQLRQPQYPRGDLLYANVYFHKLIAKYRKCYDLGGARAEKAVAKLDKKLLSPRYPRNLLQKLGFWKKNVVLSAKRAAFRFLPGVYKALRLKKYKLD